MSKLTDWVFRSFPAPKFLTMPAAALDISPNSIKYLDGQYTSKGCLPQVFDEVFLDKGVMADGAIVDEQAFVESLKELKQKHGKEFVFVAIPENALYLYTLNLAGRPSRASIMQQIEFTFSDHVPISIDEATYDFDIVTYEHNSTLVSVTAAPKALIESYERVLAAAGFTTRSIELEAYAVVRAVSDPKVTTSTTEMIVDIGYNRAGIIIARNGLPIFTLTVPGGSKNTSAVVDECKKQYLFWDTRTNQKGRRIERISRVTVCGGSASEFATALDKAIEAEVEVANIWQNLFSIDKFVPDIAAKEALAMATLSGLLLNNKS